MNRPSGRSPILDRERPGSHVHIRLTSSVDDIMKPGLTSSFAGRRARCARIKYTGRIIAVSLILFFHTSYLIYYYYRDGYIDIADWMGYPLLLSVAYWAGKQYDRAAYLSEKDVLTNLYNRRFILNAWNNVSALTDRTNSKLFILVIDCDNFKMINDGHGHHLGDKLLIQIGQLLTRSTRKSDIVARWGGDEFLVIGQYKDEAGLQILLSRLREDLERLSRELQIPVGASVGSAIYPDDSKELYELIKIADENMYRGKRTKKEPFRDSPPHEY